MSADHVMVVGATQGTGALIVERLLADGATVTVMARTPSKAEARFAGHGVAVVQGDVTQPDSLHHDYSAYAALVLTVGVTKRPAGEALVRAVEVDGTRQLLDALTAGGFSGRMLYMNSIGTEKPSWLGATLNLLKGKTLVWRRETERLIRESGHPYTIIRAGLLNDKPAGTHRLRLTPDDLPLTLGDPISRADVADVFVAALAIPDTANTTFSVVWDEAGTRQPLDTALAAVSPATSDR